MSVTTMLREGEAVPVRTTGALGPMLLAPAPGALRDRIDVAWSPVPLRAPARGTSALTWFARGFMLLLLTWTGVDVTDFIAAHLAERPALGAVALAGIAIAATMMLVGLGREWVALRRLARVDGLRALLADSAASPSRVRAAALGWVESIAAALPDPAAIRRALREADGPVEVNAVLRDRVAVVLRARAREAGQRAALEGGALVLVTPSEALDGLAAAWRGYAVIRRVARLHGLRPGPLVMANLLRRIVLTAAGVAGTELLAQGAIDHAIGELPLLRHAAKMSGVGVAAYRLYRLAIVTAAACSPLSPAR